MKTLSIKARLMLVLFVLAALLTDVGALGLVGNLRSNTALKGTFSNNLPFTRALGLAESRLAQACTALDRATSESDPSRSADAPGRIAVQIENNKKAWGNYLALPFLTSEEERIAGEAGKQHSPIIGDGIDGAIGALRRDDKGAARVLALEKVPTQFRVYAERSDHLNAIQEEVSLTACVASQSFFNRLLWIFGFVIAIELALVVGCYIVLSRAISHPLVEMLARFHEISDGNLTTDVHIHSCDEMGLLTEGLRQMQAELKETVMTVHRGSKPIASAIQQAAVSNTNLPQRTGEQASSLEEIASSMGELTSIVEQNAGNARQASTLAANASRIVVQGGAVVQDVMATMGKINESSRKITDAIAVIEGIAFQTNILAPNAAMGATRAGERDHDFTVVVGKIRTLAQRSTGTAKEIKSLIEGSVTRAESGSTLVARVSKMMEEIVMAVKRVTDIIDEISVSPAGQSTGIEQINEAVTQVDDVTQQNTALAEEAAATAQALEEQADELCRAVAMFRVAM